MTPLTPEDVEALRRAAPEIVLGSELLGEVAIVSRLTGRQDRTELTHDEAALLVRVCEAFGPHARVVSFAKRTDNPDQPYSDAAGTAGTVDCSTVQHEGDRSAITMIPEGSHRGGIGSDLPEIKPNSGESASSSSTSSQNLESKDSADLDPFDLEIGTPSEPKTNTLSGVHSDGSQIRSEPVLIVPDPFALDGDT
jgi:hypothetical protein